MNDRAPRDRLVGRTIGRYEVLHLLALGGMGAVYVGRAGGLGEFERLVAIKMLHEHLAHDEELVRMFLDEARLAARIRHSNVVATLDVCRLPEGHFLVMEYVEGADLAKLIAAAGRAGTTLPVPVVLRTVVDALAGLAAAHGLADPAGRALELVHRDVSPQNVLVGIDGLARLADFGVANARSRAAATDAGRFKGKLGYASPEHLGTGTFDQRSDLFGMGIVLWEALTGLSLFRAATHEATVRRVLHEPIPALSSVRPDLEHLDPLLARALARASEDRFQTAQEMAEAIERVAPRVGGLASSRHLGQMVMDLAHEKLAAERMAIERAVAASSPPVDRGGGTPTGERSDPDVTPPSWGPLPSPPPTFVGRMDHLGRVARLFPTTRAIVVTGPAGGGKSAFARAVVAANAGGRETRGLPCTADAKALDALERMLGLERLPTNDADRAGIVARQLDERDLVVAIEDVHVLPPAEHERLLRVVASLHRATIVLTSRVPLEISESAPGAIYVDLAPLDDSDARALVADLLDRRGVQGDVDGIVRAAAGNPLWCTLLSGAGRLSDRLVSLIEDLDAPAMQALEHLALFRRPVPHAWAGEEREMAILASRYLCADAGRARVEMHDVVRATVAASLSKERIAEIHVRHAARWADVGEHEEQLHHFIASGDPHALRDALASGLDEWLVARPWLPDIAKLVTQLDDAGVDVGSRLRLRQAAEMAYGGRLADAMHAVERAGQPAPSDVLVDCVARMSILYAQRGSVVERDRLLERAAAARQQQGRRASADWIRFMVAAIWDHSARGDRRRAIELCREVLADPSMARPEERSKVLRTAADLTLDAPSGHRDLDEADPLLAKLGSPYLSALADVVRARLHLEQGEVTRARAVYERALPVILKHDHTVTVGIYGRALEPRFAAATGKIEDAIQFLRRWIDERPDEQQVAQRSWANAVMALAAREADHPELAKKCARIVLRTPPRQRHHYDTVEALLALAAARLASDRPERAIRPAIVALESGRRSGMTFVAAPAAGLLAEVLGACGRIEESERLADLVVRASVEMELPRLRVRGLVLLGRLALQAGTAERALELAEEAASIAEATGQRWDHARAASLAGWASMVRGRGDEARAWLARAEAGRFEETRASGAGLSSLALVLEGRGADPYPWWLPPELTSVHLELDAESLRAVVDGSRVVDFASQPLLAKILHAVMSEPGTRWDKEALFERVWGLPYRSQARDAAIYKAVARVGKALDPSDPHRFLAWQDGALVLRDRSVRVRRPRA